MNFDPKTREQKILQSLFPYFGDMASEADEDEYALRVCRHVLNLRQNAIKSKYIADYIVVWGSEYPEENSMTNEELIWGLELLDEHISNQLREIQLQLVASNSPIARFKVIDGGRSKNPAIPYVNVDEFGREVDF